MIEEVMARFRVEEVKTRSNWLEGVNRKKGAGEWKAAVLLLSLSFGLRQERG